MIRFISDVHGKMDRYIGLTRDCEYSIQLGDMGYDYRRLKEVDSGKHKFICGNHESYRDVWNQPHLLRSNTGEANYGLTTFNGVDLFFVRGGFSIDKEIRQRKFDTGEWPQTYFSNEELNYGQSIAALEEYKKVKPDLVISHEAPREIAKKCGSDPVLEMFGFDPATFKTSTSTLLQEMWEFHQPKLWIFGHYHINYDKVWCRYSTPEFVIYRDSETDKIKSWNSHFVEFYETRFICMEELGYYDYFS